MFIEEIEPHHVILVLTACNLLVGIIRLIYDCRTQRRVEAIVTTLEQQNRYYA